MYLLANPSLTTLFYLFLSILNGNVSQNVQKLQRHLIATETNWWIYCPLMEAAD